MKSNAFDLSVGGGIIGLSSAHEMFDSWLYTVGLAGGVVLVMLRIALVIRNWRQK